MNDLVKLLFQTKYCKNLMQGTYRGLEKQNYGAL